jgi:hypothetical protein
MANESDDEIKDMLTAPSMLLVINDHTMKLERAIINVNENITY